MPATEHATWAPIAFQSQVEISRHSLVSHSSPFPLPLGMKNGKLMVKSVLKEAAGKLISKEKMEENGQSICGRYF